MINSSKSFDQDEDHSLIAEIDYVVHSVEKSLERLNAMQGLSPANNLLVAFAIAGSGLAIMISAGKGSIEQLIYTAPGFIIMTIISALFCVYVFDLYRSKKEIYHRKRIVALQVKSAEETLRNLKSWLDRSEMSYRLQIALDVRSAYLEALLLEVHASSTLRGL